MLTPLLNLALTWPIALTLAALLITGLTLLILGLRGRRINNHPICRKCGFDLIGIHPTGPVCPECGRRLDDRRAIRPGLRRRRWILASLGLLFTLSSTTTFAWFGYRQARIYDWNRAKPVWYILRELSGNSPRYSALMNELLRRAEADSLDVSAYQRILPLARSRQTDLTTPWDPRWGHLVETGFERAKIKDDDFNRYLNGIVQGTLKVRKTVRAGAPLPASLGIELRGGVLGWETYEGTRKSLSIAGEEIGNGEGDRLFESMSGPAGGAMALSPPKRLGETALSLHSHTTADLTGTGLRQFLDWVPAMAPSRPGEYHIATSWTFKLSPYAMKSSRLAGSRVFVMCGKRTFERSYTAAFTVVPKATPTVRLRSEEALAAEMHEAFAVSRSDRQELNGAFSLARRTPIPYAFDVFARFAGHEIPLGSLVPMPDDPFDTKDTLQFLFRVPLPPDVAVTYVLRPSIQAAELTTDLQEIWGQEIQITEPPPSSTE